MRNGFVLLLLDRFESVPVCMLEPIRVRSCLIPVRRGDGFVKRWSYGVGSKENEFVLDLNDRISFDCCEIMMNFGIWMRI
jgi:hypothetical protein